jgi:hypothetical protein
MLSHYPLQLKKSIFIMWRDHTKSMGGHTGSSWSLAIETYQGGTSTTNHGLVLETSWDY